MLGSENDSAGGVFNIKKFPSGSSRSPDTNSLGIPLSGLDTFADQGGDHVRVVEVKIVSRPVEVHEQQLDSDQAELLAISLQLHAEKFLGQAIRGIGFFRISIPQVRLPEGNRCKFGIGTDGSDKNRLFNLG